MRKIPLLLTRRVRRDWPGEKGPRVVAMTANAMEGDRELCLAAGMDDYVSKPIRIKELVNALNQCGSVASGEAGGVVMGEIKDVPKPEQAAEVLDKEKLEELKTVVGGQEFFVELLEAFLEDAPQLVAELQQGLVERDSAVLMRAAHSLKSNSADFGAVNLSDLCRELEAIGRADSLDGAAPLVARVGTEFDIVRDALERIRNG